MDAVAKDDEEREEQEREVNGQFGNVEGFGRG